MGNTLLNDLGLPCFLPANMQLSPCSAVLHQLHVARDTAGSTLDMPLQNKRLPGRWAATGTASALLS